MPQISQAAIDLIIAAEVSSRALYERRYRHPEWPGGRSGVTIAIGYDLGYATPAKVRADWFGRVPQFMIDLMIRCCGVTGEAAHALLPAVKAIDIPWDAAIAVFAQIDMPRWIALVCAEIPGADKLPADCLGALVSLAYNRGASFSASGDRYREMRAIRAAIVAGNLPAVSDQIRSMKRLWPNITGLQRRRDAEARLWDRGLAARQEPTPTPIINPEPEPIRPDSKPGTAEHGAAGSVIIAGGATAKAAHDAGISHSVLAAIIAGAIIIALVAWLAVRNWRNRPITAREKDRPQ
jgi:hypothetical protein